MQQIQIGEIEVMFPRRVSGPHSTTPLSSVLISENQWFNGVF
jgi:hypothetical protein